MSQMIETMEEREGVRIELCGVSFAYREALALDEFSLKLPPGRVTAVVGPSGAGKSTVLGVISGLIRPSAGDVLFDGKSVLALPPEKRRLGMVFQNYALFPHLSVRDNVAFGLVVRGTPRRIARKQVESVLEKLEIRPLAERRPHQLSGGERQRVALARALAIEPRALLLDEPLAALDARLRLALRDELAERLHTTGATVLYVTHDQQEAMALGDRVAILKDGKLEQEGSPEDLYHRPATPFVARFIGEGNFPTVTWDPAASTLTWQGKIWRVPPTLAQNFGDHPRQGLLLLRPEALSLPNGDSRHNQCPTLQAQIRAVTFLGDRRRLLVEAGGEVWKADIPATGEAPKAGETIELTIGLEQAVLLGGSDRR